MCAVAWKDMSAEEKRAERIERWRNPQVEFASPEAEAGYQARVDRLVAALDLREPDRVPVDLLAGFWPAVWGGITPGEALADPRRAAQVWKDFNLEFQLDASVSPLFASVSARMLEDLDYRSYSWPGRGVPAEATFQFNESEWMLADEYDHLIADPTDYLLRVYMPRTVGAFAGFSSLSPFYDFLEMPFSSFHMSAWGSPEMVAGLERLVAASRAAAVWNDSMLGLLNDLASLGFPNYIAAGTKAPFDILGDTLRGTKGVVTDMFRYPEKVVSACDRLVQVAINWVLKRPAPLSTPIVFLPLHKGADRFMSEEQFELFYWPSLRAVILGLVAEGCIPFVFAEGRYNRRLELIAADLPKGKTVWMLDQTDMAQAKQTLGKVACLQGNVPVSLMYAGTPEETAEYCRLLIDTAGEGGGFIMDTGAVSDGGKVANLRAMIETAATYGRY